jgi:alkylhydroperoxidase/carboxymuconolactone decarboxylase family protein YurZ
MDPLPELKLPRGDLETLRRAYVDLVGSVPPRVAARTDLLGRLDPEGLRLQERIRSHFMHPSCFDTKTAQLILFGILLSNLQEVAAKQHAIAARRAGATWEELTATMGLAFLFRGLSAANVGSHILQDVAAAERDSGGPS